VNLRRCFSASLVAASAALGAAHARAQALPAGVDSCLARIEALRAPAAASATDPNASPTTAPTLGDVCPELAEALDDNPWGEALAGVSAEDLETSAFVELTRLVAAYEQPPAGAGSPAPSAAALDEVLAQLKLEKPTAELSIWERIQQWYDEHFGARDDVARGWLEKWLRRFAPSDAWVGYFVIVLGIGLVVGTLVIVINELRVAGVLTRGAYAKYSPLAPSAPEPERARDFDAVMSAPLARRPVLLLALVLERLRARGALPLRDSLTHRELLRAARLSAEQSAAFGAVVGAAERVTFADWRPAERDVDPLLVCGRELLSSLPAEVATK
jgi:hypothetical protein